MRSLKISPTLTSALAIKKILARAALTIRTTCALIVRAALAILRAFSGTSRRSFITNYMTLTEWLNISQINVDGVRLNRVRAQGTVSLIF